jgi:uncharacterized membrane protein
MNAIQKTALKETTKTLAGLTAIAVLVPAVIFLIPLDVLGSIIAVGALCYATKMIYDIKLAQAKFNAEINKTVDQ